MSFILDALQKDQVEQQPQPTTTGMLPPPRPSPVKRWGMWLIGAALIINAGVLAWFLLGQQEDQPKLANVAPTVPGAQRELSMAPKPAAAPAEERLLPKRTPVRAPARQPARAPQVSSRQPAPRAQSRPQPRPQPRPQAAPAGAGRVLSPEQAAQMGIGEGLLEDPVATPSPSTNTSANTNSNRAPAPVAKATAASDAITIEQLPPAARNSFPELEFSTHIFADDPSMRAVVVNDKRLTEGEQLGELVLRAVTEEGVVFGYRSHRVAVSVVELWAE